MNKIKFLLVMVLAAFMACDSEEVFDEQEQLAIDRQLITEYLADNDITAEQIGETGIYYAISQSGTGDNAEFASSVYADYRGYLLDGTEFDSGTIDFVVGAGSVIQGWELGFQELNKGASATLFIPSKYGYGSSRQGTTIPANSVLLFDVTVVDIR
jgi:FKBP-type peptidyl-prolyl cis-trans isomerase